MATAEERARLQKASKQYTGRDFGTGGYDEAFERSGMSADDRIREILNSGEAQQYAQSQAAAQYQPLIGETDRAAAETKSDLDTLISTLEKQKSEAPEQIFNDFNRRGLFRSSMAQKEVGSQVGSLVNKIGSAQVQRSTRLADLAAQRASLLAKQTQYEIGFRDQNRNQFEEDVAARLKMEEERRQQEEALKRQLAASRQQQSWMDMFNQQQPQPTAQPTDQEEELPDPFGATMYDQPAGPQRPAQPIVSGAVGNLINRYNATPDTGTGVAGRAYNAIKSTNTAKNIGSFLQKNQSPAQALLNLFRR